jgi:hypothetical protein
MDVESVVKWSAIGLGVVALLGGAYYFVNRRQGAMAGFGAGGFYHTTPSEFRVGQRVQLHPGLDQWMRGDRYGTVTKIGRDKVHIQTNHNYKMRLTPSRLEIVE